MPSIAARCIKMIRLLPPKVGFFSSRHSQRFSRQKVTGNPEIQNVFAGNGLKFAPCPEYNVVGFEKELRQSLMESTQTYP